VSSPWPPPGAPHARGAHHEALRHTLDADGTSVALLGLDGTVGFVNRSMLDLIGATNAADVAAGSPVATVLRSFLDQLPSDLFEGAPGVWHGQLDHRKTSGEQLVLQATACLPPSSVGDDVVLMLRDVTDVHAELDALAERVSHDSLTGLTNRQRMLDHLAAAVRAQRHRPGHLAAILVDLDGFAQVNQVFGARAGDEVLVACAHRLASSARPGDHIARVGGDEFLIVAEQLEDRFAAVELADCVGRTLTGRLRLGDTDLDLTVSVGVALSDDHLLALNTDAAASRLLGDAETAAVDARTAGGRRSSVFTSQMRTSAIAQAELAADLARSIAAGEVDVEYQPIHSAVSGAAVGAEALVRWRHPTRGAIDAATTVRVAEQADSIGRLGDLVLDRALSDLVGWRRAGRIDGRFTVHVNISQAQLASASLSEAVSSCLERHGVAPHQLVLEAHESPLLSSRPSIVRSIRGLRRLGVRVAVDDFGTGAASLAVLTDVGVDMLKLDGLLSLPPGSSLADVRVVRSVVALAHSLDMDVIAEHVTAADQLERLRAAGCDMLQGHLLAPPLPEADLGFDPAARW